MHDIKDALHKIILRFFYIKIVEDLKIGEIAHSGPVVGGDLSRPKVSRY